MRIAIQSHPQPEHHHLPHQGIWFTVFLTVLMLLLSVYVAGVST